MKWFEQDPAALTALEATLRDCYPTMHAFVEHGAVTVRGTYPVLDAGKEIDRYSIAIKLPDRYPHDLPDVFETGGRIPRTLDRHVFQSGALCLGVREELWLTLRGDFSIVPLLEAPVRGFLIGNALVEEGEKWPDGDRSHGMSGILEFYEGYLGVRTRLSCWTSCTRSSMRKCADTGNARAAAAPSFGTAIRTRSIHCAAFRRP